MPIGQDKKLLQVELSKDLDSKLEEMARSSERSKTQFVRWLIVREFERRNVYAIQTQDNDHEIED